MTELFRGITRDPSTRQYTIESSGKIMRSNSSVTTFYKKFFPQFDPIAAYESMGKTAREKYNGLTREQVFALWNEKGRKSTQEGTKMHKDIENFVKFGTASPSVEMDNYARFVAERCNPIKLRAIAVEQKVFVKLGNTCLAGEIDYIGEDGDGNKYIVDWKRVENLNRTAHGNYGYGLGCCSVLENVNYNQYSLQLHMYRYMLMHTYGIDISPNNVLICNLYPSNYECCTAKDVSAIVEQMMEKFPDMVANKWRLDV